MPGIFMKLCSSRDILFQEYNANWLTQKMLQKFLKTSMF